VGAFLSVILYNDGGESVCLCEVVWKRHEDGEFLYGVFTQEWSKLDPKLARVLDVINRQEAAAADQGSFNAVPLPA
jgi:hypothetical protein